MSQKGKPKIQVIIPNAGMGKAVLEQRRRHLQGFVSSAVEVRVCCTEGGPNVIESRYDAAVAVPWILKAAEAADRDGCSAVVVYCANDPGVRAARELVGIPVVGAGEAAIHTASMLANKFSILTPLESMVPEVAELFALIGISARRLASVRSVGVPVADMGTSSASKRAREAGRLAIENDGAEALVLGCLGLAGLGPSLKKSLGVPVVDPAPISVVTAEMLVRIGLRQSRRAFPLAGNAGAPGTTGALQA